MDNAQLRDLLGLVFSQCYCVATWIIHACNRVIVVQIIGRCMFSLFLIDSL